MFLGISQNSQENSCARVSFLMKLQDETCNFIKEETLTQVLSLSCEFCEISKNIFSYRTLPVAASEYITFGRNIVNNFWVSFGKLTVFEDIVDKSVKESSAASKNILWHYQVNLISSFSSSFQDIRIFISWDETSNTKQGRVFETFWIRHN